MLSGGSVVLGGCVELSGEIYSAVRGIHSAGGIQRAVGWGDL